MKQLTLDYYFCGKKTKREVDIDDEDLLECYENAKKQLKEEEEMRLMELIWEDFEQDLLEDMAEKDYYISEEAAKDFREEMEKKEPFIVCRELSTDERLDRNWNLRQIEFRLLPDAVDPETDENNWYWNSVQKMRLKKKMEEDEKRNHWNQNEFL
jgi:hypothetical protein